MRLHREWPVAERRDSGTLVAGTADLVARTPAGLALIDHKSLRGAVTATLDGLPDYAGQLAAYAHAITTATATPVVSMWIHLPILGAVVEVHLPP